jgi:hypothetical protein
MPLYSRSVPRATRASTDTFKLPDSVRPSCSRRVASVAFEFQTPCPSTLDPLFFVPEHNIRSPFPSRLILIITAFASNVMSSPSSTLVVFLDLITEPIDSDRVVQHAPRRTPSSYQTRSDLLALVVSPLSPSNFKCHAPLLSIHCSSSLNITYGVLFLAALSLSSRP